jgi:hypothetical protein
MGLILEEVRKPEVLLAISKRSRTVVNADAMSVIMLSGLRLLANMLIPSSMEELCKPEGGPMLAHANKVRLVDWPLFSSPRRTSFSCACEGRNRLAKPFRNPANRFITRSKPGVS